ncbi:MAG: hypothetical protein FJW31_27055 [Acidobacteria bacterium]|nr:hypothetical protein [Acidobacteriota bacterium]
MNEDSIDGLLLAIYDAAENPALWEPCMELLCTATASANGAIVRHNLLTSHSAGAYHGFDRTSIAP